MATDISLDKPYQPKEIEEKWYQFWMDQGYFKANPASKKRPFVIMMPPPNITGALHLGHALTAFIQDVLIRWKRMQGFNTLWLPGSDHAGISTQNVVEKELSKENISRHTLGREKFLERVWKWREDYGRIILTQQKRFGASCDWSREHFTMDEQLSRAVREVFVSLYHKNLIYRGNYLINWCPRCESALSDLEVNHIEKKGKLWHLKYPLEDRSGFLVVATTRPETMLGDTAVAVHPKDKRYQSMVGKMILLPLAQRKIPIVSDKTVDPQFGTGAVKITPGHDFNDFELGQRHSLPMISVLDEKGRMNENAGAEYQGLDRFKARKKVLEDLRTQALLEKEEDYTVTLGHCDRCETVVEPRLSTQWFVKAKPLAMPAIDAVRKKKVKIIPEGWAKTYFNCMENIKDWCISRQIWWGHRIPAWHCRECQKITVSVKDPTQCHQCKSQAIFQDPDVLDNWFSSALWPFSTLGWPQKAKDLKAFYPSAVMETGFDILFFWVARMMMMGIYFMKKPPFKYVYLHAMVRDAQGQKMSKSKGNVIDPLDTIEKYGADALRFTMISLATQGRDIKMAEERIAGYRNFINKIWNATRFVRMNLDPNFKLKDLSSSKNLSPVHQWILTRLFETVRETNKFLEEYRLNEAANTVYHFTWHEFCDWYIELIKAPLKDPAQKEETQKVTMFVLKELLKLLHPFLPFVTEELWHHLPGARSLSNEKSIMIASFPKFHSKWVNSKAKKEVQLIIDLISQIRNLRGENNVSPSKLISATIVLKEKKNASLLSSYSESIKSLAKLSQMTCQTEPLDTQNAIRAALKFGEIFIPLTELFDMGEEKKRLQKELAKVEEDMTHLNSRLSQPAFVERAPKEVVQKEKDRFQELQSKKEKLEESLKKIASL